MVNLFSGISDDNGTVTEESLKKTLDNLKAEAAKPAFDWGKGLSGGVVSLVIVMDS